MRAREFIIESAQLGEYVYHASHLPDPAAGLQSVLSKGLRPSKTGYSGPGVYFAYNPEGGYYHVGKEEATMFRVKWSALVAKFGVYPQNPHGIQRDENEIVVPDTVPASMLEVEYFPGEWWDLDSAYQASLGPVDESDDSTTIKIDSNAAARAWIEKIYDQYPQTWQNNHVMPMGGEGDEQQFAMFELRPSMSQRGAVEVYWFQAYPLRQGVGSRAMKQLQQLAQADGISLTLFPWDKGQVSQAKLTKFYRGQGFAPVKQGSKSMAWSPQGVAEDAITELFDPNSTFPVTWDTEFASQGEVHAVAYDKMSREINISFVPAGPDGMIEINFMRGGSYDLTGKGDASKVLGTVVGAISQYVKKYQPQYLAFSAKENSRSSLYASMIQRMAVGYQLLPTAQYSPEMKEYADIQSGQTFILAKSANNAGMAENAITEDAVMGKIEQTGKIVRILKKQHTVPFSDEKDWLLIDTDPAQGNRSLGLKWIPAHTRFEWVRPYRDTVAENFAEDISHISELRSHAAQNPKIPVSQQVKNIIAKHGGTVNDYWIHNSAVDHLGFYGGDKNAQPADGWSQPARPMKAPVVPGQAFSGQLKYGAAERGFQAPKDAEKRYGLWFSPLGPNLAHMDGGVLPFANKFTFLIKLKPDAWLQPIDLLNKARANLVGIKPPAGKHRVGQYNANSKIAVLFEPAFDIVGKWTQEELISSGRRKKYTPDQRKQAGQAAAKQQADKKAALNQELDDLFLENFADGRNPQDKGDSVRHGIPKGATMAQLEKAAKAPGRKGQLARWQLNMRRGKKK